MEDNDLYAIAGQFDGDVILQEAATSSYLKCIQTLDNYKLTTFLNHNLNNFLCNFVSGTMQLKASELNKSKATLRKLKDATKKGRLVYRRRIPAADLRWFVDVIISVNKASPNDPPYHLEYFELYFNQN